MNTLKKIDLGLRIAFLFWPMGLMMGILIYNTPWMATCVSPNATLYRTLNCDAYNSQKVPVVVPMAALGFIQAGWAMAFHDVLGPAFEEES